MLEKLLLAVTITFSLNLFLGVRLPSTTKSTSSSQLAETPTVLVRQLLKEQAFRTAINREENPGAFCLGNVLPPDSGISLWTSNTSADSDQVKFLECR